MKYLAILLAALAATPAFAQSTLTGTNTSDAAALNAGNNQAITINQAADPAHTTSDGSLKTTGQAIAPGVYNASGTYNCFGGASAALGWMGAAIGGGGTVSQTECYRLHLMDKARQANQPVVYAALFCQFPDGRAAYEAAGIPCPSSKAERERAEAILNGQEPVAQRPQPMPWQAGG